MAEADFNAMNLTNIQVVGDGKVTMGYLPDGSKVLSRPAQDGELGRWTVEIIKPNGRTARKIRYGNAD
jgi:hypothetical protein